MDIQIEGNLQNVKCVLLWYKIHERGHNWVQPELLSPQKMGKSTM